ncbi:LuxR C-terminal-related transcriptional regulator [Variovorax sp. dw_954]|uniref:LuxR C-terminal-related transcriptional regulator n=1 Tax=Variovorax sp. dw_954 TaxID=2720078 RepID=UPI001BD5EDEE|nr:LuxR C-terminal-related transcriptional regulator [Variovorax sp. dw_954]
MQSARLLPSTKFSPPRTSARSVLRQHLLYRLQQSRECRLVLVSGGAGYGKTTLLAQWRKELLKAGENVAWLSLVAEDGQLAPFCASLIGALREAGVPIQEELPYLAGADLGSSPEPVAWALVNALAKAPHDVHLMIDDLHHVDDPQVTRLLQALVDCAPDRLYLVLASRSMPGLLLGRLRASGDLAEIDCADLCFDFHESLSFLKENLDAAIDADGAHWMHALTDGWPIGLQLMTIAFKADPNARTRLRRMMPRPADLRAYLLEDVIAHLPPSLLGFMERIAILRRFNADLAGAVTQTPDAAALIAQIERQNLFVFPVDSDDGYQWYRLHPLFAEFLSERLARHEAARLYLRASAWFAAHDLLAEGIRYALLGDEAEVAIGLIERSAPRILSLSHLGAFLRCFDRLPASTVLRHPGVLVTACCTFVLGSRYEDAQHWLDQIPLAQADAEVQAQMCVLRAMIASSRDDSDEMWKWIGPLAQQSFPDPFFSHVRTAMIIASHGVAGRHLEARRHYESAVARVTRTSDDEMAILATLHLAHSALRQGDMRQAQQIASECLLRAEQRFGRRSISANGCAAVLADVFHETNRIEQAREALANRLDMLQSASRHSASHAMLCHARLLEVEDSPQAALAALATEEARIREAGTDRALANVLAEHARIVLAQGDVDRAIQLQADLDELAATHREASGWLAQIPVMAALVRARIAIATGEPVVALGELERVGRHATSHGCSRLLVTVHLLSALALDALGRTDEATLRWHAALALAHRRGLLRTVIDEGAEVGAGLARLEAQLDGPLGDYLAQLAAAFAARDPAGEDTRGRPEGTKLTPRESEILELLGQMMSNKRIALTLDITYESVKWNLKNIFRKLGVSTRYDAVTRARRLKA